MSTILSYFTKNHSLSNKEGIEVYDFTGDPNLFVSDCLERFRDAYVSEDKINDILLNSKTATRKDIIERRLPTQTKDKAGDFGEILAYYLWTESWAVDTNIRPLKWRWKELPDMASHLVDVILLKKVDPDVADPSDTMCTIESKVWTSRVSGSHSSLTDALEGAAKDDVERAAKSIPYLVLQYERDNDYDLAEQVKRFSDPVNYPFKKVHNAIAIVDSTHATLHLANFNKTLKTSNPHIPVYFLPINNLRKIYDDIFINLTNC